MPHQGPHPCGQVDSPFACNTSWPAPESARMGRALMLRARFRQVEPRILSGRMAEVGERSRSLTGHRSLSGTAGPVRGRPSRGVSTRQSALGYQMSFQPAMRPPPVSAHIRKPKERGSPAKWR